MALMPHNLEARIMIPSTTRAWLSAFSAAVLGGLFLFAQPASEAQSQRPAPLQRLKVSPDKRFLLKADGMPFFYLGDTAWELFHRTDRKQAAMYLQKRAEQNYTRSEEHTSELQSRQY